jgi:cytochrome c553
VKALLCLVCAATVLRAELPAGAILFQNVCSTCHGARGEGLAALKSPAIAGLPSWYLLSQLTSFREGRRGHDVADAQAFLMATTVKSLTPEHLRAVIEHTSHLPTITPEKITGADLTAGRTHYQEHCMACHRYNGSGELVFASPPLTGQPAWYLSEQMRKFKTGQRGTRPGDVNGAKMVLAATAIENEPTLRNLTAYILTLNPTERSGTQKRDLK